METVLWILGTGAAIGVIISLMNKENPLEGAAVGGLMAGSCLVQLLVPVILFIVGLFLFRAIFG